MERLRLDLIRRARQERQGDLTRNVTGSERQDRVDLESNNPGATRSPTSLLRLPNLTGRRREHASTERTDSNAEIESPKSPDFGPRRPAFHLPNIGRLLSREPEAQLPMTELQHPTPPQPTQSRGPGRTNATTLDTPDPANILLAQLADDGRRRRGNRAGRRTRDEENPRKKPKRFLGCLPWVKSRRTRSLILRCLVSGIFFGILLAVCKSQALAQTAISLRDLTLLTNFVRSGTGRH